MRRTRGKSDDYWASVVLLHFMRDSDFQVELEGLLAKYPSADAKAIVANSMR